MLTPYDRFAGSGIDIAGDDVIRSYVTRGIGSRIVRNMASTADENDEAVAPLHLCHPECSVKMA